MRASKVVGLHAVPRSAGAWPDHAVGYVCHTATGVAADRACRLAAWIKPHSLRANRRLPMSNLEKSASNGVNVDALLAARAALTQAPEAAQFKWRATSEWLNGTHSRTTIAGFHGLGSEQKHRQTFQYDTDHPEIFASEDNGPTPVEYVLVGLAGCLSAGIAAVAQNRNIQLRAVKATL